ncbi:homoprotocatechuate degradation operon regulator HpaR [Aurantimonas sp. VKM B-3413]|uniref:homoprotocatechuate degradation operon regulator HpaR n=1 Tax=Aurantimonas sp. VKM B-3413 TaxID=2779401 RepID=UPI00351D1024
MKKALDTAQAAGQPARTSRGRLRDFSRSLPMSLLRAREAVMGHFRPGLRHFDLTEQQWRVLRALTTVESIGTMNLASATFLLPPSLSRIIRDLEARGLIERSSVAEDLRRGMVAISPTGRDLVERAGQHSEAIYAEITRRFGAERLQLLQSMLKELEEVLEEPIKA